MKLTYLKSKWQLYFMLILPVFFVVLFNYLPLFGLVMAFQNYNPAQGFLKSEWVGFKWFRVAFNMPDFKYIFRNTLVIAVGKIIFGLFASVSFALLLNEVKITSLKRSVQTITYFPHFLSWVILGGIFTDMLSVNGLINKLIVSLGGAPLFFLGRNEYFQPTLIAIETWKEFGWGAIVYLAAIADINPELYEAAKMDGANRFQNILYITIPGISHIIVMMVVLNLGNILNAGFEQILVLYNAAVYETGDILDTFIYRQGLLDAQYSLSTAIGLFKSVISLILTLMANHFATKYSDYRIF